MNANNMMEHYRKFRVIGVGEEHRDVDYEGVEEYRQPMHLYVSYNVLMTVDLWLWRHRPTHWVMRVADRLAARRHHRRCNDDCGTAQKAHVATSHTQYRDMLNLPDEPWLPACTYNPPSEAYDLWLYDLSQRRKTKVRRYKEERRNDDTDGAGEGAPGEGPQGPGGR